MVGAADAAWLVSNIVVMPQVSRPQIRQIEAGRLCPKGGTAFERARKKRPPWTAQLAGDQYPSLLTVFGGSEVTTPGVACRLTRRAIMLAVAVGSDAQARAAMPTM